MLRFVFILVFSSFFNLAHADSTNSRNANENFDCEDLIGSWSNERYDKTLKTNRRMIETISADGRFWIKFIYGDGQSVEERESHGTWECAQDTLTIVIPKTAQPDYVRVYKILELNTTSYKLLSNGNCGRSYGDCGHIVYEYFKVIN